jgi:hypothetical protein
MSAKHTNVTIRQAAPADVPFLAELWLERAVVQRQMDRRFELGPGAEARWTQAAAGWVVDSRYGVFVAEKPGKVVGCVICRVENAWPGLLPEPVGLVVEMLVGLHSAAAGVGSLLFEAARGWFDGQAVDQVIVCVPRAQPVEQAFWRAMGAKPWMDVLWVKL